MDFLFRLLVTVFLGVIIGIERDDSWKSKNQVGSSISRFSFIKAGSAAPGLGGVRTHILLALFGFALGLLHSQAPQAGVIIATFIGCILLIVIASYILNFLDKFTLGITTEISFILLLVLSFLLGAHLLDVRSILAIGVLTSLILSLKIEFRSAIAQLTKKEILETLEFSALAFVIFPWLPNIDLTIGGLVSYFNVSLGTLDPIVLLNPSKLWTVVVFITALNFVSYFLGKVFRSEQSILMSGLLGGLVSSTSVTQLMALKSQHTKERESKLLLLATTIIANATSFVRIPIIVLVLNAELFSKILPAMILMVIVALLFSATWAKESDVEGFNYTDIFKSPLALRPALLFAGIFTVVQIITQIATLLFGSTGFAVSTLVASLSGMDAIAINTAKSIGVDINLLLGAQVLVVATIMNLLYKVVVAFFLADRVFSFRFLLAALLIGMGGLVGLVFI